MKVIPKISKETIEYWRSLLWLQCLCIFSITTVGGFILIQSTGVQITDLVTPNMPYSLRAVTQSWTQGEPLILVIKWLLTFLASFETEVLFGMLLGFTQWYFLPHQTPKQAWIITNIIGSIIGWHTTSILFRPVSELGYVAIYPTGLYELDNRGATLFAALVGVFIGATGGLVFSLIQRWHTRSQKSYPNWWITAQVAAWSVLWCIWLGNAGTTLFNPPTIHHW